MTAVDSWGDDWDGHGVQSITVTDLPRTLTELRDGIAVDPPTAGAARARRIEQMQHDIALCADFVADCDRYEESIRHHCPTLTPLVPKLVKRYVAELRQHAIDTHRRLRDDLTTLRAHS